jgi:alpha-1,2-glucosyltransferase
MLPLHLANSRRIFTLLCDRPIWIFIGACGLPLFVLTFWADHGYNNFGGFIHNEVVFWLRASLTNKVLAYLAIVWCFYSLLVTELANRRFYWLYPLSILAVLPHSLIEQRYFMIPIVLFLALRKRTSDKLDHLTMSVFIIASWLLCMKIHEGTLFF